MRFDGEIKMEAGSFVISGKDALRTMICEGGDGPVCKKEKFCFAGL